MPARPALGADVLGGSRQTRGGRQGGLTVPGYAAAYYWTATGGLPAVGQAALGGRTARTFPSAGLSAAADPTDGTVTVPLWWAWADTATLTRITPDGTRTPVRGSPISLPGPSRRNASSNPKARDDLTGYAAGSNTTITRLTGLTTALEKVTTGVRATATAAGAATVQLTLDAAAVVSSVYGLLARTSAAASSIALSVTWYDAFGVSLGVQTFSLPPSAVTVAATAWAWSTIVAAGPAGAVTGVASWVASGLPAGGTFDLTARVTEGGGDIGATYFDGDYRGGSWIGTAGLSYSDLAALAFVVDTETPLDVPVRYELSNPAFPGFIALSDPVTINASDVFGGGGRWGTRRRALLTHPGMARTVRVWIEDAPTLDSDIGQGEFKVRGRRRKVVVQSAQRDGYESSLTLITEDGDEFARLLGMLEVPSPMLLRLPAGLLYPPLWWLSFGKLSIEPLERSGMIPVRKISVPVTEVDRPSVTVGPVAV